MDAREHPAKGPHAVGREQAEPLGIPVGTEVGQGPLERLALENAGLGVVEDPEARVDARGEGVGPQQAVAEAVDRRDPRGVELPCELGAAGLDEPPADAVAQLACGAFGVGDDQERVDVEPALADRLDEALHEHRRLPGSGAGRDEDDAGRFDRRDLLGIGGVHWRLTRHMGARSHHDGQPASPRGSCLTSPARIRPTNPRACSVARSIWAQNSSSSR